MSVAVAITEQDFGRMIITGATSGSPSASRDVALLYTLFMTGLMPSEIAGLKVSDFQGYDRRPISISKVRHEISCNGKDRPLHWTNPKLQASLSTYLSTRTITNIDEPLFLSATGRGFTFRTTIRNGVAYRSSGSITNLFNALFVRLGYPNVTANSGRKTLAVWLFQRGASMEDISALLGQSTISVTKQMLKGIERKSIDSLIQTL